MLCSGVVPCSDDQCSEREGVLHSLVLLGVLKLEYGVVSLYWLFFEGSLEMRYGI